MNNHNDYQHIYLNKIPIDKHKRIKNLKNNHNKNDIYNIYNNNSVFDNSFYTDLYIKYNKLNENLKKSKLILNQNKINKNETKPNKNDDTKEKIDDNNEEEKEDIKNKRETKKTEKNVNDSYFSPIFKKLINNSEKKDVGTNVFKKKIIENTILPFKKNMIKLKLERKSKDLLWFDKLRDSPIKKLIVSSVEKVISPNKNMSPKKSSLSRFIKKTIDERKDETLKYETKNNELKSVKSRINSIRNSTINYDKDEEKKNKRKSLFCCF